MGFLGEEIDCGIYRRQQYRQAARRKPTFARLYDVSLVVYLYRITDLHCYQTQVLIVLEGEIEEALPQFQDLMLSLSYVIYLFTRSWLQFLYRNNPEDAPAKEATAARKRLLEAFAEYDALAKRIRKLPCPEGPGSSQDRVQAAILIRANLFLQKNMFPLQVCINPGTMPALLIKYDL